jgi:hypothetical protein
MSTHIKTSVTSHKRKTPRIKVSLRLDPEIHEQVRQIAEADKRSFSQVVELILSRYLNRGGQKSTSDQENSGQRDIVLGEHSLLEQLTQTGPHGTWSQYDAYEAAATLKTLLDEHQTNSTQHDSNNAPTV